LQITIKSPNIYFPHLLTSPVTAPIPKEALDYYKNDLSNETIGTGPFILKKYVRKSRMVFEKNKAYREKYFPKTSNTNFTNIVKEYAGKKVPLIDKIIVHIIKESQTGWLNFLKGKIDLLELPKDNYSETFTATSELTPDMKKKEINLGQTSSMTNVYYFGFNQKHPFLKNKLIRQAIAYAFDQERFNKLFFNQIADLAQTILPPNIPGNSPPLKSPYIGAQIDVAKKLLKKAGHPNGKGISKINILVKNKTISRQVGEFLAAELKKIGIESQVETASWSVMIEKAQKGKYDIFFLAWYVGIPSGLEFFEIVYGPNHPHSYNRVGYLNNNLDNIYNQAKQYRDPFKQNQLIAKINEIVLEDLPIMPLVHSKNFFINQAWLKNYTSTEQFGGFEQYFDIDLLKKKELMDNF